MTKKPIRNNMVQQFQNMEKLFDFMDQWLNRPDNRYAKLESDCEEMENQFDQIDQQCEQMDNQFNQTDQRLDSIDNYVDKIDQHFEQVNKRFN
ncbi:hypothetical protein [Bacillus solimangrovi]|uniref:t-SNARE coiled-coil homology domain-containing protein n=1 Tax=Bacillus solimangrovi TaxID=1305675 RepID=A0A1E5LIJ4_9BACI|nr:hypothetical protein [Bacillus solimangrovi]OEH93902.1 hypothetical protein BFG57_10555 [Bacillus solimangrovi]